MERLGEDPNKYYSGILTMEDKELMDIEDELTALLRNKSKDSYAKVEEIINRYERLKKSESKKYRQLLLFHKADLAFKQGDYSGAYDLALAAIGVTKTNFDEQTAENGIYTSAEIDLVNLIAASLFYVKSPEASTMLYLKLKESLDKNYRADQKKQLPYLLMLYNITFNLIEEKKHEKCLPLCTQGVSIGTEQRNYHYLSLFLYHKGYCLLHIGDKKEGLMYTSRAYALFYATLNVPAILHIKKVLENEFKSSLSDLSPSLYLTL